MYGTETAAGSTGALLALTGVSTGAWVLTLLGVIFAGMALAALTRRNSKTRP